jgi:hypothetical protein
LAIAATAWYSTPRREPRALEADAGDDAVEEPGVRCIATKPCRPRSAADEVRMLGLASVDASEHVSQSRVTCSIAS